MQVQPIDFDARIDHLRSGSGLRYTSEFFEIIADGIVAKYIAEMDVRFGKKHTYGFISGDRSFTGIVVSIPRDPPVEGFWRKFWNSLCNEKRVLDISVCWGWRCEALIPEYQSFAERMTRDYYEYIAPRLQPAI